ncbi:MAG: extracellular solute-binding protein [Anaerolineae bacterium]|nr:extracellular solute-binding protein [Anaerolineae bacterium]
MDFSRDVQGPSVPLLPPRFGRRFGWGVISLLLLLTACLPAPPSSLPTEPASTPTPLPTWTPSPVPRPSVTMLTLWVPEDLNPYREDPGAVLLAQRLASFSEAHPDFPVQVIVKKSRGRGGVLDFLRTAYAAAPSVLPDLVVLDLGDFRVAAQSGLLQPIDPWLQEESNGPLPLADLYPFALEMGRAGEKVYGLPLSADLEHLAYRPAQVAAPPASWKEVLSAPTSLIFPALGVAGDVDNFTLAQYLAAGGRLINDAGEPMVDEEPLGEVLEFYALAVERGIISPQLVLSLPDARACWEQFLLGKAGITVVDSRQFWTEEVGGDVEPAPFPTRDGHPIALVGGSMLGLITGDPERQRAAVDLMAWLLEPTWYGGWTQATGRLPVVRGGLEAWAMGMERRVVLATLLESARVPPPASVRSRVGPALQRAVEAVLTGEMSPRQAAAEAAR